MQREDIDNHQTLNIVDFLNSMDPDPLETEEYGMEEKSLFSADSPLGKFENNLKNAIKEMNEPDFTVQVEGPELPVGKADIIAIFQWLLDNMIELRSLTDENPLRFQARSEFYPLPITIHLIREDSSDITLILDPNSKKPRVSVDQPMEKYPEIKDGEKARKIIGRGGQKIVRYAWCYEAEFNTFSACAANIYKGESMVSQFYAVSGSIYQKDNPFLVPTRFGADYEGHTSRDKGWSKAISFAALADGTFYDLMNNLENSALDMGDVLWIYYASVSALAEFHRKKLVHRDVKPDNFLFFRTSTGIHLCLNDFDQAMSQFMAEYSREIICFPYYAFDAPFFAPVIGIKNALLRGDIPDDLKGSTKSPEEQVREKALENFPQLKESINLILDSKHIITVNTPNHPKSDIWALCKILKMFNEKIKLYFPSIPPILTELDDLIDKNFRAGFEKRMDGTELLSEIRKLYKNLFAGPVKGMDEKDRIACRVKFNNQLDQMRAQTSLALYSLEKLDSGKEQSRQGTQFIKGELEEKVNSSSSQSPTLNPPLSRNIQGSFAVNVRKNSDPSLMVAEVAAIPGEF